MKAMVGLIIAILIVFGLRLFWPSTESGVSEVSIKKEMNDSKNEQVEMLEVTTEETDSSSQELNATSDDERTRLMKAEYEILEQERKKLKRHLARLKHDMWGLKFSREDAKQMSTTVMGASNVLRNPDMLGAFSNVEDIKDEIAKVNFAEKSLQQVSKMIEASNSTGKGQD
jgi:cell shape-determining protein MreC